MRESLGWKPKYTFETMLDEMISYWLDYYDGSTVELGIPSEVFKSMSRNG